MVGEADRSLIAAVAGATVTDAAAWPPVDATAVTVTLPEATAVTLHLPLAAAAVATAALLDEQLDRVGAAVVLPPVI